MPQHDFEITTADANTGVPMRAQINAALQALASLSSGAAEPVTPYAYQLWADDGNDLLKIRTAANNGWVTIGKPSEIYLGLASLSTQNEFTATQKLDGDALLLRFNDTGASGEEWAIRSDGGNVEIVKNTGTEGTPTWTVQVRIDVNALRVGDGTAADIRLIANNAAATKPEIRYQNSSSKWQYSNDGSAFSDLGIEATAVFVPVRQTVLAAAVDANGYANFISIGSGLAVNIDGTPTPVRIAFAAGFGANGALNYVGTVDADTSISSLAASTTNYLFAERNAGTGAVTLGKVSVAPIYSYAAPSHAANQYWFSIPEMVMYLSNGTDTWTAKQVVFIGEAVTDGSSVTSVINYALRGEYMGAWGNPPATNAQYTVTHNIGVNPKVIELEMKNISTQGGYGVGETCLSKIYSNGTTHQPLSFRIGSNTAQCFFVNGYYASIRATDAAIVNCTSTYWQARLIAKRGW